MVGIALLDPRGTVAAQERDLIVTAVVLMLAVVVPVFVLLYTFAWKYRAGNRKAKYDPERAHGILAELVWWAVPAVIVAALAVITWRTAHALDPWRPLAGEQAGAAWPLTVQIVALDWKWLFIYPEQGIATVNFFEFPERTPVEFNLTADGAPMNSFWIPQLGGQMYAMAGMSTKLHLAADAPGEFAGGAAEINGRGFAGMHFVAKSATQADFDAWVASVKRSPQARALTEAEYDALAAPSENNPPAQYSSVEKDLYNSIVAKFMVPAPMPTSVSAPSATP